MYSGVYALISVVKSVYTNQLLLIQKDGGENLSSWIVALKKKKTYNQKVHIYIFLGNTMINSLQMMITLILDG